MQLWESILNGNSAGRELFAILQEEFLSTETARPSSCVRCVFLPRHGTDPNRYILPHQINHRANMKALCELSVREIVAINSAGSLHRKWKPGTIMVPDDFIMLTGIPGIHQTQAAHLTPQLDLKVRHYLLDAARE